MWMTDYIREVKKAFRDQHGFVPTGGVEADPLFEKIPDGTYPCEIEGKINYVVVKGNGIHCCNFDNPQKAEG